MCSNYTPSARDQFPAHFGVDPVSEADFEPEAYPSYMAPVIRLSPDTRDGVKKEAVPACFGMVPHWADLKLARHTYNARSETVGSKPSFRHAYRRRQFCIIPAESIYEPCYESGKAVRWRIARADGKPLGLAGIWEFRPAGKGEPALLSFSMLTINADDHPLMQRFHRPEDEKRMVVVLREDDYDSWLQAPLEQVPSFLTPYPAACLAAEPAPRPARPRARNAPAPGQQSSSLF
mgnify:FL=1